MSHYLRQFLFLTFVLCWRYYISNPDRLVVDPRPRFGLSCKKMNFKEAVERIWRGKRADPLKGVFLNAALSWTQLPLCAKDMVGHGCGVFREVVPSEISNFFETKNSAEKSGLVITIYSFQGERNHRAWVWGSMGSSRVVFSVKSLIETEGENHREIWGVKNLAGENVFFAVLPGSLEWKVYRFLLEKAKDVSEIMNLPSACLFCAAKNLKPLRS